MDGIELEGEITESVEKLIAKLTSSVQRQREAALLSLLEQPPEKLLEPVSELLLEQHDEAILAHCLDLLEKMGAVVSLAEVRTDGWFEQLGARIKNFDRICEVMGSRFLAYSIILGIHVRSLAVDSRFPVNTKIEFTLDGSQVQSLPLGEFRLRVVQALIQDQKPLVEKTFPLTVPGATAMIGGRALLLAPLFGICFEQIIATNTELNDVAGIVGFFMDDGFHFMRIRDFNILIFEKIKEDLASGNQEPFKLDLELVPIAREAFEKGDLDKAISTLDAWPGLLSILLKTPMARTLEDAQRESIGEGLEILGASFERLERDPWSEELYKLGLQFAKEGNTAGRLYLRLGMLLVRMEKYGEAIGPLRRALTINVDREKALCSLAHAFLRRGKIIPAAALFEYAAAHDMEFPELEVGLVEVRERLQRNGLSWDVPVAKQEIN